MYKGTKIQQHTPLHSLMFVDSTITKPQNAPIPDVDLSSCNLTSSQTQQLQQLHSQHADLDLRKPSQFAQELKSNLKPNINDTLMHCSETSTMWL